MNIAAPFVATQPVGVRVLRNAENLESFRVPACSAAIWQRDIPKQCSEWFDAIEPAVLPRGREVVSASAARQTAAQFCDEAGTPSNFQRDWFIDDIGALALLFAGLMRTEYLAASFRSGDNKCVPQIPP